MYLWPFWLECDFRQVPATSNQASSYLRDQAARMSLSSQAKSYTGESPCRAPQEDPNFMELVNEGAEDVAMSQQSPETQELDSQQVEPPSTPQQDPLSEKYIRV